MATIELQSSETLEPLGTTLSITDVENLAFVDGEKATPYEEVGRVTNDQFDDTDDVAHLGQYLSRPVEIQTFTWTEGVSLTPQTVSPWYAFFNNTYIRNKIANYSRLRCKLKLKFVINASPFYYGSLRACYFPLEIAGSPQNRSNFGLSPNNLIRFSQTPGVYLEPQGMSNVEMTLPFVWDADWLNTYYSNEFRNLGTLSVVEYVPLRSANGVPSTGVTVKVYAWAEDVELAGPSKALILQSDEYETKDGVISKPATAIAGLARMASSVPVFAPYARVTEMGATLVAGVAKMLGYSNPPLVDDAHPVTVKSFHALANVETRIPMDVLAVDPKNEIAFASSSNGYTGVDELAMSYLTQRESFLLASSWTGALAPGTPLVTFTVNPGLCGRDTGPPVRTHYTPVGYISELFRFWRGSLKFRFKFIKTKYHRGRVSITWDPSANVQSDAATETTNLTRIIDLEVSDEAEIVVPYKATTPYLLNITSPSMSNSTTPSVNFDPEYDNGLVSVKVLNALTGPAASPAITILTYISAGEDFEFAVPGELPDGREVGIVEQSAEVLQNENGAHDKCMITTGERIGSIRPLLHRTSYWSTQTLGAMWNENDTRRTFGWRSTHNYLPKVPAPYGRGGGRPFNWATVGGATTPFTFCKTHPMDWILNAFAAYKGSTNMTFNVHRGSLNPSGNGLDISEFSVARFSRTYLQRPTKQNRNGATANFDRDVPSTISRAAVVTADGSAGPARISGRTAMSLTNVRTQAALQVHVPQYINRRCLIAWGPLRDRDPAESTISYVEDSVDLCGTWYQSTDWGSNPFTWPIVDIYYGAGVDFNPFFFVCAPSVVTSSIPDAVNTATPV